MSVVVPAEAEDYQEDNYKGGTGWITVACGCEGSVIVLDWDLAFGAFRYMRDSVRSDSAEELGVECLPDEPGVYKGQFKAHTSRATDFDGADNDLWFSLIGDWEELLL